MLTKEKKMMRARNACLKRARPGGALPPFGGLVMIDFLFLLGGILNGIFIVALY